MLGCLKFLIVYFKTYNIEQHVSIKNKSNFDIDCFFLMHRSRLQIKALFLSVTVVQNHWSKTNVIQTDGKLKGKGEKRTPIWQHTIAFDTYLTFQNISILEYYYRNT